MIESEYLNKIKYIDMMINCKIDQVSELRNLLTGGAIRYDTDKVQTSLNPDKMSDIVSKIIELEEKINDDVDKLVDLKNEARILIEKMNNDIDKVILYKRYFSNKTFEQIAVECNYSYRQVKRKHDIAVKNFEKILKMSSNVIECHS